MSIVAVLVCSLALAPPHPVIVIRGEEPWIKHGKESRPLHRRQPWEWRLGSYRLKSGLWPKDGTTLTDAQGRVQRVDLKRLVEEWFEDDGFWGPGKEANHYRWEHYFHGAFAMGVSAAASGKNGHFAVIGLWSHSGFSPAVLARVTLRPFGFTRVRPVHPAWHYKNSDPKPVLYSYEDQVFLFENKLVSQVIDKAGLTKPVGTLPNEVLPVGRVFGRYIVFRETYSSTTHSVGFFDLKSKVSTVTLTWNDSTGGESTQFVQVDTYGGQILTSKSLSWNGPYRAMIYRVPSGKERPNKLPSDVDFSAIYRDWAFNRHDDQVDVYEIATGQKVATYPLRP